MAFAMIPALSADAANLDHSERDVISGLVHGYMDGRETVVKIGDTEILKDVAVEGIVNDEVARRAVLSENNINISDSSYQIVEIDIDEVMAFVTLNEHIEYVTDNVAESADIEHNLTIMYDEYGTAIIVSDRYMEVVSGFASCSYVSEEDYSISLYNAIASTEARAKLVSIATGEIGYKEKASDKDFDDFTANAGSNNYTKYGKWYGINPGAWCAMFVSWCANQAGASTYVIPKYSSCSTGMQNIKNLKCFYDSSA